jgi:hypothetical protein
LEPIAKPASGWGGYIGSIEARIQRSLSRARMRWEGSLPNGSTGPPSPGKTGAAPGAVPREPTSGALPLVLALGPAVPNPSSRGVTLRLDLPEPATVRFTVMDVAGRRIQESTEQRAAGRISLVWPQDPVSRAAAAPGIYFARVSVNGKVLPTRRWVVIR